MFQLREPFVKLSDSTLIRVGDIVMRKVPPFGCPLTAFTVPAVVDESWFLSGRNRIVAGNFFCSYRFNPYPDQGYRPLCYYEHPAPGDIAATVKTVYGAHITSRVSWTKVTAEMIESAKTLPDLATRTEHRLFDDPYSRHIPMLFWRKIEVPFGWYLVRKPEVAVTNDDRLIVDGTNYRGVYITSISGKNENGEVWYRLRSRDPSDRCFGILRKFNTVTPHLDGPLQRWKRLSVGDELNSETDQVARVNDLGDVLGWDPLTGVSGTIRSAEWMYRRPLRG